MRLIDADELEELFREVIGHIAKKPEMNGAMEHMVRASAMVVEMIHDAPTVEPRKIAHWNYNGFEWKASCSECGESCATYSMGKPRDRYCKWCGARMMEEGEDDATD